MSKRIWYVCAGGAKVDCYEALLNDEIVLGIEAKQVPDYSGLHLLRREHADGVKVITVMEFGSVDAIKAFVVREGVTAS